MIETRKSRLFEFVFRNYNKYLLRKHFSSIHVSGAEVMAHVDRTLPMIFYGNHSSWWDGLLEYYLATELLHVDCHLMMEEKQMKRYAFFRKIGAFSVNRNSPREGVKAMRYAASLFDRPNRLLWIYPQGRILPSDTRPLVFFTGATRIAQMIGREVQFVPYAHRYEFLLQQRPEAFVAFGAPERVHQINDPKKFTERLEESLTTLLDDLRRKITQQDVASFQTVLTGRRSTNETFDAMLN